MSNSEENSSGCNSSFLKRLFEAKNGIRTRSFYKCVLELNLHPFPGYSNF
jgi:hypothetical protein